MTHAMDAAHPNTTAGGAPLTPSGAANVTAAPVTTPQQKDEQPPALPVGDTNQNPPSIGFWKLIREDLRTHDGRIMQQGFWVLAIHRFGNWRMGVRPKLLRLPFTIIYKLLYPFTEWMCGVKLSYNVKVGRRVKIEHFGGMILGARSIGDDCVIRQNTTFGIVRRDQPSGKPIIEDRVDIGAGACLLGHIRIGHDSVIGANAVVVRDVPPYSVVVGVPGKVIRTLAPKDQAQPKEQQA